MKRRAVQLCLIIIAAQVVCVTLGLWIHRRLTVWLSQNSDAASGSALAAGAIALFWTVALLAPITYILLTRFGDTADRSCAKLRDSGVKRSQALVRTRDAIIFGLAKLADSRDPETGAHLERITYYASMLTSTLRRNPKYRDVITAEFSRLIEISTALHDIGKVGIPDSILLKPGQLTDAERATMETHSTIGGKCLRKIEQCLGSSNFLQMAREIAFYHHERWDGSGYPSGLSGEQIPLSARIVALADVYDALSSPRVYKPPFPHEKCLAIIHEEAAKQFDPDLVEAFLRVESSFRSVAQRHQADSLAPQQDAQPANQDAEQAVPVG